MAEQGWIRKHILKTAIGTIVVLALTAIWQRALTLAFLKLIWHGIVASIRWLNAPVTTHRYLWWLGVIVEASILVWFIASIVSAFRKPTLRVQITWKNYRRDELLGYLWRWGWTFDNHIDTDSLCPHCLTCDRMIPVDPHNYGPCIHTECGCGANYYDQQSRGELFSKVVTEIDLRLRNGGWRSVVERQIGQVGSV